MQNRLKILKSCSTKITPSIKMGGMIIQKNFCNNQPNHQNNSKISQTLKQSDFLWKKHLGSQQEDIQKILNYVGGFKSLDELMMKVMPAQIYDKNALDYKGNTLEEPITQNEFLNRFKSLMQQNKAYKNFIGQGYYGTILPPVIQRGVLENQDWYTSYSPYQAEISQGRMQSLLNYQTMICELTGLSFSNASLLDEGTSASEALALSYSHHNQKRKKFFVSNTCFQQTIDVVKTKGQNLGLEVIVANPNEYDFKNKSEFCGVLLQSPDREGHVHDYTNFVQELKNEQVLTILATDLLALTQIKTPGDMGFDCAVGTSQRFGVPLGYGGPHAAFFVVNDPLKRKIPGRVIGITKDSQGNPALRLALQTREQHIRREKATSNICTAQALLANMAAMYGLYHGAQGLKVISQRVNELTQILGHAVKKMGLQLTGEQYFDTITIQLNKGQADEYVAQFLKNQTNIFKQSDSKISVSLDETTKLEDVQHLINIFGQLTRVNVNALELFENSDNIVKNLKYTRQSNFMQNKIFTSFNSEFQLTRYIFKLMKKDISLTNSMIPLGSCTMKLNATSEMIPLSWPEVANIHPFTPHEQTQGYLKMIEHLTQQLKAITNYDAFSFQSNSGAMGEYNGLLTIKQYLKHKGQSHRNICLIPNSAHGTNPASAIIAGFKVVAIKNDQNGNIDMEDLKEKAEKHSTNLAAMMVTYPSTFGVFEAGIKQAIDLIHEHGGQIYMDGANMNAQVGYTSPGFLGADVCHLNLHKTFAIPHGGGGPGMGPIGVKQHLADFLPGNFLNDLGGKHSYGSVGATQFGSASILAISYSYISQIGLQLKQCTALAILNANYLMKRLESHYKIRFGGNDGLVAHEFIIDIKPIKDASGITEEDIAKRLQDYGFHAPTMSWPVPNTLMIEPTESEDLYELDRYADALINIKKEVDKVISGEYDKLDNPLKNAPHTQFMISASQWNHKYTREEAAYPLPYVKDNKFWPSVGRVDNVYGDRNLICACGSVEDFTFEDK